MTINIATKYYVTVTDITKLLNCNYYKAKEIFNAARDVELDSGLILAHDHKVALKTVAKLTGFDINLWLRMQKAKEGAQHERRDN